MMHKPFAITLDPGSSLANHTGTPGKDAVGGTLLPAGANLEDGSWHQVVAAWDQTTGAAGTGRVPLGRTATAAESPGARACAGALRKNTTAIRITTATPTTNPNCASLGIAQVSLLRRTEGFQGHS